MWANGACWTASPLRTKVINPLKWLNIAVRTSHFANGSANNKKPYVLLDTFFSKINIKSGYLI